MIKKVVNKLSRHEIFNNFKVVVVFVIVAFFTGAISYYVAGEGLVNAIYSSLALFYVNPVSQFNNLGIIVAKFLAPLSVAGALIGLIKDVHKIAKDFRTANKEDDAIAIYSDTGYGEILASNFPNSILVSEGDEKDFLEVKTHIVMYSDDEKSLSFYRNNAEVFAQKKVYVLTNSIDSTMVSSAEFNIFNLNEMIARRYWTDKNTSLISFAKSGMAGKEINLAIIGDDILSTYLLKIGLQNNIYDVDQKIIYHYWGDRIQYDFIVRDIDMELNSDVFIYHEESCLIDSELLKKMDRFILCDVNESRLLQDLIISCSSKQIHFFDPIGMGLEDYIDRGIKNGENEILSYGKLKDTLNVENIMRIDLLNGAKRLSYYYNKGFMSKNISQEELDLNWNSENENSYTKQSSIAACDYHEIRKMYRDLITFDNKDKTLAELEHLRWCRFLYTSHWSRIEFDDTKIPFKRDLKGNYMIDESGDRIKDTKISELRQHTCLRPFEKLPEKLQKLDYETVYRLTSLESTMI